MIFVYNANSGAGNALWDVAHKFFSPNTYRCQLCTLTHDTLFEKKQWQQFRENTAVNMQFLHKDEFENQYGARFNYPVVLNPRSINTELPSKQMFEILLTTAELQSMQDTQQLIQALSPKQPQNSLKLSLSNAPLITSE